MDLVDDRAHQRVDLLVGAVVRRADVAHAVVADQLFHRLPFLPRDG